MSIAVNEPIFLGNEKKYLCDCIDSGWISSEGPYVAQFEEQFAKTVRCAHGVAVSSGTAALEVACRALKLEKGDEVILPTFTIISCIQALLNCQVTPVLVDSCAKTWNMDVSQIEAKITPRTRAIMVVHTYGLPVDMAPVLSLAKKYGLQIIEDAAQAIGQNVMGQPCGSLGDIGIFSFYPNKHITTGEGGMVVCHDSALAKRARSLRNLCFQSQRRFYHEELGYNFRMTNLQAALGCAQLENLPKILNIKRQLGKTYQKIFNDLTYFQKPIEKTSYGENLYWVYGLVSKDKRFSAPYWMRHLAEKGIGTRPFFWPLHWQPVFKGASWNLGHFPVAEHLAQFGFYLPSGTALTVSQIQVVNEALRSVAARFFEGKSEYAPV